MKNPAKDGIHGTGAPAGRLTPGLRVVAIGDELVDGHTADSNGREIVAALDGLGLRPRDLRLVRDEAAALRREVEDLLDPAGGVEVVISTGGLGPTVDDRSRQVLADAFGAELVFDEARWRELEDWFRERGRVPGPLQRSQALHPRPGRHLRNEVGTADGLVFEQAGRLWIALPGVPSEMRHLLAGGVLPLLTERFGARPRGLTLAFRSRRLPEADLARRLEPLADLAALGEPGFYPNADGVLFRLRLPPLDAAEQEERAGQARRLVRSRLGPFLLAESGKPVVELVFQRLRRLGATLVLAESCTGGWLARDLTDFPGASAVFRGGVVAYANEAKQELLGVPPALISRWGAVSPAVAAAMARGVRQRLAADWGLAVTGIAGPEGGSPQKAVGTVWLGLVGPAGETTRLLDLRGNREQIRRRAAGQAWAWLFERLPESGDEAQAEPEA
ncbi:MAG: CinA family nicotinamide mononucleotide deamidase-related protein [bacterium]|jgi:nicotinamide-nucleotide amidase|nr:CinA family nicotinamide mononucleotide deamidase-related protein [bacterium]